MRAAHAPKLRAEPTARAHATVAHSRTSSADAVPCDGRLGGAGLGLGYYSLRDYNLRYYKRFFEEGAKIGSGSFGSVFVCRHKLDGEVLGQVCHARVHTVGRAIEGT